MKDKNITLAIIVPCYNEEDCLSDTMHELNDFINNAIDTGMIKEMSHIYYIDDGSQDSTWSIIKKESLNNPRSRGIKLSRNRGHQNAMLAGLLETEEDVTISIDADLQDDINVMKDMIQEYHEGSEIVFGIRNNRDSDSFLKRITAEAYYALQQRMGIEVIFNHADFRLMSRKAINSLKEYHEVNLFLRGLIHRIGYRTGIVTYSRKARLKGETKYPFVKMMKFAWDGITSFSNKPLQLITKLGIIANTISVSLVIWVLYVRFFTDRAVPGWTSTLVPLLFIGSVQLLSLGIIGEYVSKIYLETKRRPNYHIEDRV